MTSLNLIRFPETKSTALKAWNAADELILEHAKEINDDLAIYNDAFGYLTCHLFNANPICVVNLKSQETAIIENLKHNELSVDKIIFNTPLSPLTSIVSNALLKVPKSTDLFELYIQQIHANLAPNGIVYCGFMTKYFNASLLKIAEKYFETVTQSQAKKKARLLILSGKKIVDHQPLIHQFEFNDHVIQQYYGVFTAKKIDFATQYLLDNLNVPDQHDVVLDLASGNGIIAKTIQNEIPESTIHLVDDSYLAIESSKLNIPSNQAVFHHEFSLSEFEMNSLDWVVTNPPFHFGHTIDISIPLNLFQEVHHCLKKGGHLTIVANSNLGYLAHLKKWFDLVEISHSNSKFSIYDCTK